MTFLLRLLLFLVLQVPFTAVQAADFIAGNWVSLTSSRARLILPRTLQGITHGALEVELEPGAKTYWRTPGETGVPTVADFSGSRDVKPSLLYPAPEAFDDGIGGVAYGYTTSIIFPLRLDVTGPVPNVAVTLDYGICLKNMCLPAQVKLSLASGEGQSDPALTERVQAALAAVPQPVAFQAEGDLALTSVTLAQTTPQVQLRVTARVPADGSSGAQPLLFAEGAETMSAKAETGAAPGTARFLVTIEGMPGKTLGSGVLTLKLGTRAIETKLDLDAAAKQP